MVAAVRPGARPGRSCWRSIAHPLHERILAKHAVVAERRRHARGRSSVTLVIALPTALLVARGRQRGDRERRRGASTSSTASAGSARSIAFRGCAPLRDWIDRARRRLGRRSRRRRRGVAKNVQSALASARRVRDHAAWSRSSCCSSSCATSGASSTTIQHLVPLAHAESRAGRAQGARHDRAVVLRHAGRRAGAGHAGRAHVLVARPAGAAAVGRDDGAGRRAAVPRRRASCGCRPRRSCCSTASGRRR